MSRPVFLPLYRYLVLMLNRDTVNIVLHYFFGDPMMVTYIKPLWDSDEEDYYDQPQPRCCWKDILSERDLVTFLKCELIPIDPDKVKV